MDIITLALTFLLEKPDAAAAFAKSVTRPGEVQISTLRESFADLARGILHCYHRTARYQQADVLEKPWGRQADYAAQSSAVIQIQYRGVTGNPYEMHVAVMSKGAHIRTAVLRDTAVVPYSTKCQLEQWSGP